MKEIIDFLKKYTDGKQNTEKVEISVLKLNRVIKALEQKPCEDAISRSEALRVIDYMLMGERDHKQKAYEKMKNLPSVYPKLKWISVSEKLPKSSGEYLVSVIDEYDENYEAVGVAWFARKKDYGTTESEWRELGIDETVIAWMTLPKPYEPQESEGEE